MVEERNQNNGMDQLLLEAMTVRMEKMMDSRIDSFLQELHQARNHKQRRTRKEETCFRQNSYVIKNENPQQRRYERDKWSIERNKQSEAKPSSSNSFQKQQDSMRSHTSSDIGSSSNTSSCFSEDNIRKAIFQAFKDVEEQLRKTRATCPSLEEQNQEPESASQIQEDQTEIPTITSQKDDQPMMEYLVLVRKDMIEKEAPKELQTDTGLEHIFVFDPYGFQKTVFGTFLISPFVWNKTREMELSRHELFLEHVVFEAGGELWSHSNKIKMIEKESAAETFDFVYFSPSEDKILHVSAQKEFHYETNWKILPTLSWIQQTRQRRKWPPGHQTYFWRPGSYVRLLISLGEHSARDRIILGQKELEDSPLDQIKLWKPPDLQQFQYHYRDFQTRSGDGEFTRGNGEVNSRAGEELMFSSQIKEKPPYRLSLQQTPKQPTRGNYLDSKKRMKPDLLAIVTGQTVLSSTLFEKKKSSYETICPTFLVLPTSTRNQFKAETNPEMQITDSTTQVSMLRKALKDKRRSYKQEEDKLFKPPDLDQHEHQDVTCFILIKEAPP
ncbi:hypothetical protein F2Q69_00006754 [Brassica cretica]|uniref:Uncharacterized protein n=1 Tax=Brassica cretica TaxID=69181 RepID=A0A8S9NXN3_BRACR|nr:hypothetical protein F2Q69_00006754 [Brassica cretica]